ncbi:hypothetical protein DL98DRAFT_661718 [Cadophora sp. DSE1049]|nr:hypothetical protein DL98DRAFT_661718 [Cadophora sp. DSE1049]
MLSGLLGSKPFQFIIGPSGPDRKLCTIHTAVVESLSGPLAVMMNGSMHEAIDGVATLEDVDEQTFVRFCEYAYMGDYTPAQQQHVLASFNFDGGESPTPMRDHMEGAFAASKRKERRRRRRRAVSILLVLTTLKYCVDNADNAVLEYLRRSSGTSSNDAGTRWSVQSFDQTNL